MKRIFFTASAAVVLLACGNDSGNTVSGSDTANHSAHQQTNTASGGSNVDTTGMAGKSMMSIMQSNMDQMKAVPSTGNPDNDFAGLMKIHHMGAIEMAELELARGTDAETKGMAQKMIDAQQREIAELNTFLSMHDAHGGGSGFYNEVMGKMNNMKMDMDHLGSIDKQFVQMMIPHHQGAIDMAQAYLKSGAQEEKLKSMANKIISDQQKEIQELQAWLSKNP